MMQKRETFDQHWFFGPVLKQRALYTQVIIASVCVNLFALVSAFYVMTVYDRVIPNETLPTLFVLTIGVSVVICFDFAMKAVRSAITDKASANIDQEVGETLFDHISRNENFIGGQPTGAIATTVKEFDSLKDFMASATLVAFADLPFVFLFLFVLYSLGGPIAAVPAVIVIVVTLVGILVQPIIKARSQNAQFEGHSKQSVLIEVLNGLETLKTLKGIALFKDRWMNSVTQQGLHQAKTRFWSQLTSNLAQTGQQISQVGIVVYGVILIIQAEMSMGSLIACVILSGRTLAPLGQISSLLGRYSHVTVSYDNLRKLFDKKTSESEKTNQVRIKKASGRLIASNISLTYPRNKRPAIAPCNISIDAGEKVGIVGRIGSGKTSLLKIFSGLLNPSTGFIQLDGIDLQHLHPDDLRTHFGLVLQNPVVFSGSIKQNLLLGDPNSSDDELMEASRISGVDSIASELPDGFETIINEQGQQLSGGQRQAICIARCIVGNPKVVIMDEPSSAMDSQSESLFLNRLKNWLGNRTFIVVTHRGSILNLVDRIIVIDSGQIVSDTSKEVFFKQQAAQQSKKSLGTAK